MSDRKWHCLQVQHGGSHYKGDAMEPAQYIAENKIGFLAGTAIKYLSRYQRKAGAEDLKKAIHFCQMALEAEYGVKSDVTYVDQAQAVVAAIEQAKLSGKLLGPDDVTPLSLEAGRDLLREAGFSQMSPTSRGTERRIRGRCVAVWHEGANAHWFLRSVDREKDGTSDIVLVGPTSLQLAMETFK